jgi:hypothetical protein
MLLMSWTGLVQKAVLFRKPRRRCRRARPPFGIAAEVLEVRQMLSGPTSLQVTPATGSATVNQPVTLTANFTDTDQNASLSDMWTISGPNGTTTVNHTPTLQAGTWTDTVQFTPTMAGSYTISLMTHDMMGHMASAGAALNAVAPSLPTISSLSASSGSTAGGASIIINGTGFTSASSVTFGGVACAYAINSASQITATTPVEAAGTVDVQVTTPAGMSVITTSDKYTFVPPAPTVTGLSISQGSTSGGDSLVVTGSNFTGATGVFVDGASSTFAVVSSTSINVTTPAHAAGTGDLVVVGPGGSSATSAADRYTYAVPVPTVTGLNVQAGPAAGGTPLTITGTNLGGAVAVSFGGMTVMGFTVNPAGTSISVMTPAGVAGIQDVKVTTAGGTSAAVTADQFNFVPLPTITHLNVSQGPTGGGTLITLTGANLGLTSAVFFGSAAAQSFLVNPDGTVSAVAPSVTSSAPLTTDITVVTAGGSSSTNPADRFTFYPAPVVSSLSRTAGPTAGGGQIVVSGSNLSAATQVFVGSTASSSIVANADGTLTVILPPEAAGTADLTVVTPGGTSSTGPGDHYTFVAPPVVTSLSTSAGSTAGGGTITISGSNLGAAVGVYIGAASATFTVNPDGTLSAVVPQAAAGTTDVTVVTAGGVSALGPADQYTFYSPPAVTGLSAPSGSDQGGSVVTVSGTGLSAATSVFVGTAAANFTVNPDGTLSVVVPAGALGSVNISVVTPGGVSPVSAANQFIYVLDTSAADAALAASNQAAIAAAAQSDTNASNTEAANDQTAANTLESSYNTALGTEASNDQAAIAAFVSGEQGADASLASSDQSAEDTFNSQSQSTVSTEAAADQAAEDTFNSEEQADTNTENSSDDSAGTTLAGAAQTATDTQTATDDAAAQALSDSTSAAQQQYNGSVNAATAAYNAAIASGVGTVPPDPNNPAGTTAMMMPYMAAQDPTYVAATQAADAAYTAAVAAAQQQYQTDLGTALATFAATAQPAVDTFNQAVTTDQTQEEADLADAANVDVAAQEDDQATGESAVQTAQGVLQVALQTDQDTRNSSDATAISIYNGAVAADQATFNQTQSTANTTLATALANDQTAYAGAMTAAQTTYQDAVANAQSAYNAVASNSNSSGSQLAQAAATNLNAQAAATATLLSAQATAQASRDSLDSAAQDAWSHTMDAASAQQTKDDAQAADVENQAFDADIAAQEKSDAAAGAAYWVAVDAAGASQATANATAAFNQVLADDAAVVNEIEADAQAVDDLSTSLDPAEVAYTNACAQAQDNLDIAMAAAMAAHQDAYAAAYASGAAAYAASQPNNPLAQEQAAIGAAQLTYTQSVDAANVTYATATGNADAKWYTDVGPAMTVYLDTVAGDQHTFVNSAALQALELADTQANDALTAVTGLIGETQNVMDAGVQNGLGWFKSMATQIQQLANKVSTNGTAVVTAMAPQVQKLGDAIADDATSQTVAADGAAVTLANALGTNLVTWASTVGNQLQNAPVQNGNGTGPVQIVAPTLPQTVATAAPTYNASVQAAFASAQVHAQAASYSGPTLLGDLGLMVSNPWQTTKGWFTGIGHGWAMIGNAATFHQIDALNNYVNNTVTQNGGAYGTANVFAHIGVYSAYAAGGWAALVWAGVPAAASSAWAGLSSIPGAIAAEWAALGQVGLWTGGSMVTAEGVIVGAGTFVSGQTIVAGLGAIGGLFTLPTILNMSSGTSGMGAFDPFVGTGGNAGFGNLIGWGTGAEQAAARTASITIEEINAAGITRPVAQYWLKFYQSAVAAGRGAATAEARVALMQRILELLGG